MPAKSKTPQRAAPAVDRYYPAIEEFVEQEPRSAVGGLFESAREKLSEAKGTKAQPAKKALAAIDKAESLLHHLFDVKERLASDAPQRAKK